MYFRKLEGLCVLPAALPLLLFLCCAAAAHAAGQEAGTVVSVTPGAFVERDGQRLPLEAKAAIYAGDVLVTDATGRLRAWMRDETTLSLGSDTEFEIEAYDDRGDKPVFTSRMTGLARMLTGKITRANPEGFRVATPQATVGIRGTILSVRSGGGKTTVFVENTLRQVVVNGVTVPSGSKAEVPVAGAAPRVSPMTPADRQELGASLAARGGSGGGAGGASSGVMAAASSSAAPAAAASAPAGLNVDNMLADSSSALSQAIALHQEATVTGRLVGGEDGYLNWSGSYTLTGVNLASGAFRSGAMMLHENNGAGDFNLSGGAGVLNGGTYHLTGVFSGNDTTAGIAATGSMTGTVHSGTFNAETPSSAAGASVDGSYQSTSVTH
ncbi:MAG: hypothetical protein E7022_06190 [Desulfovibrio desulfuricans]|jgi:hypothetical protein|nr:hypothetical protein [Desulfovibrio desulfuricans]